MLFSVYIILNKTTRMKNNHSVKTQNLTWNREKMSRKWTDQTVEWSKEAVRAVWTRTSEGRVVVGGGLVRSLAGCGGPTVGDLFHSKRTDWTYWFVRIDDFDEDNSNVGGNMEVLKSRPLRSQYTSFSVCQRDESMSVEEKVDSKHWRSLPPPRRSCRCYRLLECCRNQFSKSLQSRFPKIHTERISRAKWTICFDSSNVKNGFRTGRRVWISSWARINFLIVIRIETARKSQRSKSSGVSAKIASQM